MSVKVFSVNVELDIHAVTCPGVWLCPNGSIILKVYIFGSIAKTSCVKPIFPLLYHQKLIFEKTLKDVYNLADLQHILGKEMLYAELIQYSGCQGTVLATFESSLLELLYPSPCLRKGLIAGVDVNLLMEPTNCFPGILAPKIEVSTKTTVEQLVSSPPICKRNPGLINPKMLSSKHCSSPDRVSKCKALQKSRRNLHRLKTQDNSFSSSEGQDDISTLNICNCRHCCLMQAESYPALKADTLLKCPSEQHCKWTLLSEKCHKSLRSHCNCINDVEGSKTKQRKIKKGNCKKCQCCLEDKEDGHHTCQCSVCTIYKSYFGYCVC